MLRALAALYGKIADIRNYLYDRGILDSFDLGAHTVSIGNITAGGTGKTPLVALVARLLTERGETVCILTRGYGRKDPKQRVLVSDGSQVLADAATGGDEPVELAQKLLGKALVIADADRVAAAEWAKRKFGVSAFVLDDGFQHRRARRDVDIVCIDGTDPFGGGEMLPSGRLRELPHNVARTDVVVITRAGLAEDLAALRSEIARHAPSAAIFTAENGIANIRALHGKGAFDKAKPAFAFCGLGNPESFFSLVRSEGIALSGSKTFGDHHVYSQTDIADVERMAGHATLITTAKDAVKLREIKFDLPCFVVGIEVAIDDPDGFKALI